MILYRSNNFWVPEEPGIGFTHKQLDLLYNFDPETSIIEVTFSRTLKPGAYEVKIFAGNPADWIYINTDKIFISKYIRTEITYTSPAFAGSDGNWNFDDQFYMYIKEIQ